MLEKLSSYFWSCEECLRPVVNKSNNKNSLWHLKKNKYVLADPDIRFCVLASLDERFDAHLAQAENLQALFVALNDQVFEIRELAICTVGRLSSMNPAFVMPFLRKMLIQVMERDGCSENGVFGNWD